MGRVVVSDVCGSAVYGSVVCGVGVVCVWCVGALCVVCVWCVGGLWVVCGWVGVRCEVARWDVKGGRWEVGRERWGMGDRGWGLLFTATVHRYSHPLPAHHSLLHTPLFTPF